VDQSEILTAVRTDDSERKIGDRFIEGENARACFVRTGRAHARSVRTLYRGENEKNIGENLEARSQKSEVRMEEGEKGRREDGKNEDDRRPPVPAARIPMLKPSGTSGGLKQT
jgi:hypothetical protein